MGTISERVEGEELDFNEQGMVPFSEEIHPTSPVVYAAYLGAAALALGIVFLMGG